MLSITRVYEYAPILMLIKKADRMMRPAEYG